MAESEARVTANAEQVERSQSSIGFIDRALSFLSSVKLGITLMLLLIFFSILGTIIIQYNVDGFEKYYASLTPAQRQLYQMLGLFDLFHTWWFNALLILFSLNLILVSIDLFPKAWRYVAQPKLRATPGFLRTQPVHRSFRLPHDDGLVDRLTEVMRAFRWRPTVTINGPYTTVFAERGVWNRFVVFIVHIAVLVILAGAFVGSRWGYEGIMPLAPGETANAIRISGAPVLGIPDRMQPLPFTVVCTNIRVDLRDPDGPLAQGNFDNWYTDVKFVKGDGAVEATVYLNHPVDYEGYRFFQASFSPQAGEASDIVVEIGLPQGGQRELTLVRNKPVQVDGLGRITFVKFYSDFGFADGQPRSVGTDYKRPAAELEIVRPDGRRQRTFAFSPEIMTFIRTETNMAEKLQVGGYSFTLKEFTRAPLYHVLQVQYDPGVDTVYFGFVLLCVSLIAVFVFSHERVWAVIEKHEDGQTALHLAGHTNRNPIGFEKKFTSFVEALAPPGEEITSRT